MTISAALALPRFTSTTIGIAFQFVAVAIGATDGIFTRIAALGGDDELAARQKFFADIHRLVEQAAGIPAQINESAPSCPAL